MNEITKMVDYSKGKIYKIVSTDPANDDCYVGSTTNTLSKRLSNHKSDYRRWKDGLQINKTTSFKLFNDYGVDGVKIILIETYPCKSKDELLAREEHWRKEFIKTAVNKKKAFETVEEGKQRVAAYRQENKEKISERKSMYYKTNKDKICEKRSVYYQENKEKISERKSMYYQTNKDKICEKRSVYYQANRDILLEGMSLYRQNNKEKLRERLQVLERCKCGSTVKHGNMTEHKKTKKHLDFMIPKDEPVVETTLPSLS